MSGYERKRMYLCWFDVFVPLVLVHDEVFDGVVHVFVISEFILAVFE